MTSITKFIAPAVLAMTAALAAAPAAAQVQGAVATTDVTGAIIASTARATAYNEVSQTYSVQLQQQTAKNQELQEIYKVFDTNKDNQIDDAELAAAQSNPQFARAQVLEQEIAAVTNQIDGALIYAIQQIMEQIRPSVEQAATTKKVQMVLQPSAVIFAPPTIDITQEVVNVLNTRLPRVAISPPQDWRPTRNAAQMYEEVQQRLTAIAMVQQRQQQQQAQTQGSTEAPVGR